jgi:hypothetical protein
MKTFLEKSNTYTLGCALKYSDNNFITNFNDEIDIHLSNDTTLYIDEFSCDIEVFNDLLKNNENVKLNIVLRHDINMLKIFENHKCTINTLFLREIKNNTTVNINKNIKPLLVLCGNPTVKIITSSPQMIMDINGQMKVIK